MNYICIDCKRKSKKYEMNDLEIESIQNHNYFICSECINMGKVGR